tara:strand:+ start:38 stop:631 length:594 start_codon:yes stop_codon:yes gene_type:complete
MFPFPPQFNNPSRVFNFDNFLSKKEISQIKKLIKPLPYEEGEVYAKDKDEVISSTRISQIKWIPQNQTYEWLYNKLIEKIQIANSISYKFDIVGALENIQYTEYNADVKGHYGWHIDLGEGYSCFRKISMSILLSNPKEFEGGDLEFDNFDKNGPSAVLKGLGTMTIFPSYMPHRVTPVTKGERKSLVLWVGGSTFK